MNGSDFDIVVLLFSLYKHEHMSIKLVCYFWYVKSKILFAYIAYIYVRRELRQSSLMSCQLCCWPHLVI